MGMSPFEIVHGYQPQKPIHLLPTSTHIEFELEEAFAQHISQLHRDIFEWIHLSNEAYAFSANFHGQFKEFQGDLVMIRFLSKRFLPNAITKFHACSTGPF